MFGYRLPIRRTVCFQLAHVVVASDARVATTLGIVCVHLRQQRHHNGYSICIRGRNAVRRYCGMVKLYIYIEMCKRSNFDLFAIDMGKGNMVAIGLMDIPDRRHARHAPVDSTEITE
jgi:hypothetical protein